MSVDVIMPNHNQARFVQTAIRSVIEDPAVSNVIVYDDASTDASREVIRALASDKVRLICGETCIGASSARAAAVQASRSEYVYLLDSDDFLESGTISACIAEARAKSYDLCLPPAFLIDEDGTGRRPFLELKKAVTGPEAALMTLGGWKIFTQGLLRRKVYDAAVQSFQPYGYSDDELLSRHIFLQCGTVGPGRGGYNYRVIPKEPTPERHLRFALTAGRALVLLATHLPDRSGEIGSHFAPTVRSLLHCWAADGSAGSMEVQQVSRGLLALAAQRGWSTSADRLALRLMIKGRFAFKPMIRALLLLRLRIAGALRGTQA